MKIVKILIGLLLVYAVIRAAAEEGSNVKGMFSAILVIGFGGALVYIIYVNYFKKRDSR
jgi:hypothetical protein